jgi:secreted PhoX family phosphatase
MTDSFLTTGYTDGDVDTNPSTVPSLEMLADERYSRRQTLFGGLGATSMALFGTTMLAACGGDDSDVDQGPIVTPGAVAATSAGRVVTLTATTSSDVITGAWTQTSGEGVTLTSVNQTTATFIAPAVSAMQDLVFTYNVTTHRGASVGATSTVRVNPAVLGFAAVPKNLADVVTVPAGYTVTVMTRLGDPLAAGVSAYANNGTDGDFDKRIGDHGDALAWFGLSATGTRDDNSSTRGLMVQNHENLNVQYLHPNGPTNVANGPRPQAEALKEMMAHGVSVSEYNDGGARKWTYVANSTFNRRVTPATVMQFNGPAARSAMLATAFSTDGTRGRGTINNCANGISAWGTNLTCEENWAGYFRRGEPGVTGTAADNARRTPRELASLNRYGVTSNVGNYAWSTVATTDTLYTRWDARVKGASAAEDFRNEPNQYGWVVEIDPYDPASTPRKRTALGRFGHEGAFIQAVAGKRLGVYMGDDGRREYLYKYVSNATWTESDRNSANRLAIGDKYLDAGTLYVARFEADGTGRWLPLVFGQVPNLPSYTFADQADILINARLAADAVGATPMDRPEWTGGNPVTGEIYLTLTNNNAALRPLNDTNAANPRHYNDPRGAANTAQFGNPNGHIVRLRENGDDPASSAFRWDIYLFGADSADSDATNVNVSGLTADNDFSSPDGLYFSRSTNPAGRVRPLMWLQTDDGAMTDRSNCMMLAALPGTIGDGAARTITNRGADGATATQATFVGAAATAATLRRFMVGPVQCELTGIDSTPDGRTIFVGIQHPGEEGTPAAPSSNWPDSQGNAGAARTIRPRSAIVAITKDDGGVIAL